MEVKGRLVEKVSKTGKPYVCVELFLSDRVTKLVFLNDAEVEVVKMYYAKNQNK